MSLFIYLLNALLLIGLMMWLRRQSWAVALQPYFIPALLLKFLCAVVLGLLYHHYYTEGDTLTFFKESLKLTAYARENPAAYLRLIFFNEFESEQFRSTIQFTRFPGFSNSFFMLKCTSLLNLLTGNSYYLNALYLSVFSFWGMAKLAAKLTETYPATKVAAVFAFLFFPSVVFWSSGLLKDAVMMGSMCWVVAFVLQLAHAKKISLVEIILLPLMLYVFIRIKLFFSAALLLFMLSYLLVKLFVKLKPSLQNAWIQIGLFISVILIAGIASTQLISIYNVDFIVQQLVRTYEGIRVMSLHVQHLEYPALGPSLSSVILYSPVAFINALFRPFIGEAPGLLYLLASLENLLLLVLLILAVASLFAKRSDKGFHLFYLAIFFFIVTTAVVVGISTPNFGTLIRYRIVFLPFLVYLLLQNYYAQRLLQRLKL